MGKRREHAGEHDPERKCCRQAHRIASAFALSAAQSILPGGVILRNASRDV
jgi:hypothetical protein